MTFRLPKIAAVGTAATALALGAYALGSQSDGAAVAAKTNGKKSGAQRAFRARADDRLAALAKRLGVSEAKLRAALQDARPAKPAGKDHDDIAAALATALSLDQAKVTAALDKVKQNFRPRAGRRFDRGKPGFGPQRLAAALAKELGVSTAKVEAALETVEQTRRDAMLDEQAGELATALGADKAKVKAALEKLLPQPGNGKPRGIRRNFAAQLGKELGLKTADVKAAFEKLRKARVDEFAKQRDAFAQTLATKLGISVDKVKSALFEFGPRGGGPGPGGPGFGHGRGHP
jgi:DNA-binding transcriptional MerR regulator